MSLKLAILALMVASTTAQLGSFINLGSKIVSSPKLSNPLGAAVGAFDEIGGGIKDKVSDIKTPVDQTIANIGSKQCETVKRLLGTDFDQVQGLAEPDLDEVTLNLASDGVEASFKLSSVVEALPKTPGFDPHQPLVIFMHGFVDDDKLFAFPLVNEAFQTIGHYNILGLNASPLIRFVYLRASTVVRLIGERLGETLAAMVKAGLKPQDIHLVGHSLGSQIAGFAGKSFQMLTGLKVGRITGLDPAGPCFSHIDDDLRLNPSDAEYVDVIHSNGGVYGLKEPIGHADYFPNGGEQQPDCLLQACSHLRVVELFAESVRTPNLFPALRCDSWEEFMGEKCSDEVSLMGYGSKPGTRGLFYLRTGEALPFALGAAGLRARDRGAVRGRGSAGLARSISGFLI